jgi:hypothetical protein
MAFQALEQKANKSKCGDATMDGNPDRELGNVEFVEKGSKIYANT